MKKIPPFFSATSTIVGRCFLALLFAGWLLGSAGAAVTNRSVSGSQQFTVFCPDRPLRERLASACDEVRRGLFSELGLQLGPNTPIYLNVSMRKIVEYNSPTWTTRWLDTPTGPRIQIDVLLDDEMREQRLQEHIVSALLMILKYQDKPPAGGEVYEEPPAWLVEGLSEKIRLQNSAPDAVLYRGLLNATQVPDLAEWLKIKPVALEMTSLNIYRAYACALVSFFEGEPQGRRGLLDFLRKAPADPQGSIDWLAKTYPTLGAGGKNLPKWWSLSLAKLSASDRYEAWSGPQTEETLARSLSFRLFDRVEYKTYKLEQFADFMSIPGRKDALEILANDLIRLTVHAHPLFRPILAGYLDTVRLLQRGKTNGVDKKLVQLADLRVQLLQRLGDVSEYLTWFEATQMRRGPSEFEGYFKWMRSLQAARSPSREPIGQYLDAMEAELKN